MGGNLELKLSYSNLFYQGLCILREHWLLCTYLDLKIKHIKAYLSTSSASRVFDASAHSRKAWKLHVGDCTETTVAKSSKKRPVDRCLNKHRSCDCHGPGFINQVKTDLLPWKKTKTLQSVVPYKTSEEIIQDNKILIISSGTREKG